MHVYIPYVAYAMHGTLRKLEPRTQSSTLLAIATRPAMASCGLVSNLLSVPIRQSTAAIARNPWYLPPSDRRIIYRPIYSSGDRK